MKPWFLVRTATGRRWHIVDEFIDDGQRATIICTTATTAATQPHRAPEDLGHDDIACTTCATRLRNRAGWYTRSAALVDAHLPTATEAG